MKFETERLYIRTLNESDIERMVEYRNKPEVSKYQSWRHYSLKDATKRVNYIKKHPYKDKINDNTQLAVLLKDQTLIGDLHLEVLTNRTVTIGYTLDSQYWHQGYGREAVRGLIHYLEENTQKEKVIAYIYKQNIKSKQLLLDLGFKKFDESFFYQDEGYVLQINIKDIP